MLRFLLLASLLLLAPLAAAQGQPSRDAHREFVAALALQWQDDHEAAIEAFDRVLEIAPESGAVHDALAESYTALDRREEAVLSAEAAARLSPSEAGPHLRLAALLRETDAAAAASALETALALRPSDPGILADLADLYASIGRDDEAVQALTDLSRVGETPAVHMRLAAYARASGDTGAVIRHLRRAVRLAPDEGAASLPLAEALRAQGEDNAAAEVLTRYLARRPSDASARAALAELTGDAPEASASVQSPADRLRRARDLYDASGEEPDGLDEAETLIASVLASGATPEALALGGRIAFALKNYAAAADRLVRALDENPRDAAAWPLAIRALARSGDDRAGRVADDGMLFLSSDPDVSAAAAEALLARGNATNALRAAPDTPDGHALRAMALSALSRPDDAASALESASGADPVLFHAASGDLALARGDESAARTAWGRALARDPENAWLLSR